MRICIVYDCLFPWTVGGAERWYRNLAAELVGAGHHVTYLTRLQWDDGEEPAIPGVEVIAVSPADELYGPDGSRRVVPPLRFGAGVLWHLLRHRRAYDAVHLCAFPYFSLIAARLALAGASVTIGVDWFEVWTGDYWRSYLGRAGAIGAAVQRLCARLTPRAFVFSALHARRLSQQGLRGEATRLAGLYTPPDDGEWSAAARGRQAHPPIVLFAGRHIREKRAPAMVAAIAAARERVPDLRGLILGDGPERSKVLAEIERLGMTGVIEAPGFVAPEELHDATARASCLVLPSVREGYGLVVIEAAAVGTPSVVVRGEDNAATELVREGINGFVAASTGARDLGAAIARVIAGGEALRASTAAWFDGEGSRLTSAASADAVVAVYAASACS